MVLRNFEKVIVLDDTTVLHTGCGGTVIKKTVYNRKGEAIGEIYQCNKCHKVGELTDFTREKNLQMEV